MDKKKILLTATLALASPLALAEFYIAAEYLQSDIAYQENIQFQFSEFEVSGDDSSSGGALIIGYSFNDYIAVEAGYGDYGTYSTSGTFSGLETLPFGGSSIPEVTNTVSGSYASELEVQGFKADVVGKLPIGEKFYLKAAVGGFLSDSESKTEAVRDTYWADRYDWWGYPENPPRLLRTLLPQESVSTSDSEDGVKLTASLGAGFKLTDHISTEISWSRYFDVLPSSYDDDLDVYSFRLQYNF